MTNALRLSAALATLAALGLAAALPLTTQAQGGDLTLSFGDAVTVSSAGTAGIYHGQPVTAPMSGYTSYTDNGSANVYGNIAAVDVNSNASFILEAGGTLTGSPVQGSGLVDESSGPVTVSGGTLTGIKGLLDNQYGGTLTVTGGTFTGGQEGSGLMAENGEAVTISGGAFAAGYGGYGLDIATDGAVISGGATVAAGPNSGGLYCDGAVTVTGGTFDAGQDSYGLRDAYGATTDLYGSFSGLTPGQTQTLPSSNNPNSNVPGVTGFFTGTLEDSTGGQTFTYDNSGTITLHDVAPAATPEPSQFAAFSLGLLGLGALAMKARKHGPASNRWRRRNRHALVLSVLQPGEGILLRHVETYRID